MNWIYKTLRLGRCKRLTIKRFLRAPLRHIRGRRLIIHTLPRRGWMDRDEVLLHASFQLLVDYMEDEKPGETIDWSHHEDYRHAWAELTNLYHWWTVDRKARHDPLDDMPFLPFDEYLKCSYNGTFKEKHPGRYAAVKRSSELEIEWWAEDNANLHRLINIREYMWT